MWAAKKRVGYLSYGSRENIYNCVQPTRDMSTGWLAGACQPACQSLDRWRDFSVNAKREISNMERTLAPGDTAARQTSQGGSPRDGLFSHEWGCIGVTLGAVAALCQDYHSKKLKSIYFFATWTGKRNMVAVITNGLAPVGRKSE